MFEKEWLPYALSIGVSYNDFWNMTLRRLRAFEEAHRMKLKIEDEKMWMQGIYFMSALDSTVCNNELWRGKGKKAHTYFEKPLLQDKYPSKSKELTEEEKVALENQKLAMSLKIMQTNFELSKSRRLNQGG